MNFQGLTRTQLENKIVSYLEEKNGLRVTAVSIAQRLTHRHFITSNDPEYRRVLNALNRLHEEGRVSCKYVNRYTPMRWYIPIKTK